MKIAVKVGLLFALAWIILKLILFATLSGEMRYNVQPAILTNILFLLLAITIGLYLQKRNSTEETSALGDIKNAMSAGVPYTIIVSLFIFTYYSKIDPGYIKHQIAERSMAMEKELDDPAQLKKINASNEDFEVMTKEEILEKGKDNLKATFSAGATMTLSMLGMLVLSTINSIFVTVVYRRIVFKR